MTEIRVFDPAMCCSTGICGPSVDPKLARFAADLAWLKDQGVAVERFNLAQQPAAFATDPAVVAALEAKGEASLPLVKVNGEVKSSGVFPSRDELAIWAGVQERTAAPQAGGCCGSADQVEDEDEGGCCGGAKRAATDPSKATSKRCCCD
ncbi:MAG: arsenite efflux transporter metallochaperone ArsD [Myxococcales bacterium]|nr:arsenite efflux transporter metallochaperone ArsD [Myxococcales bacterium]